MKIHAIDSSGGMYCFIQKIFCALRSAARPDDMIIQFDDQVIGRVRKWKDVQAAGHESLKMNVGGGTLIRPVFNWMDSRFLSVHDTLVIYSDMYFADMPVEDTFYRTEFVDLAGNWQVIFPNHNLYRIGSYDEGYQVIPWPDHPSVKQGSFT